MAYGQLAQRENFWLSACVVSDCRILRLHPGPCEPGHPQADTRRVVCACTHYLVFKEPTDCRYFRGLPTRPSGAGLLMLPLPASLVNHFLSGRQGFSGRPSNRLSFGEPSNPINHLVPCQPLSVPGGTFSWLPLEPFRAETKNCSHRAGAISHRCSGGSRPRQKGNIRRGPKTVNPNLEVRSSFGSRRGLAAAHRLYPYRQAVLASIRLDAAPREVIQHA